MKKLLALLALALAGTACQQQAPTTQAAAAPETAAPRLVPVVNKTNRPAPAAVSPLSATARELLRRYDFSPLLGMSQGEGDPRPHRQDGFFGAAHRRIEVVFTDVRRDENQPDIYYLRGKNRYKGTITPFAGTLTIVKVVEQPKLTRTDMAGAEDDPQNEPYAYTAVGRFVLREDSSRQQSGVFRGEAALDWAVIAGKLQQYTQTSRTLTQGGNFKFEGTWTQYGATEAKPVVWVENIFGFDQSRHILKDFVFGERDPEFNPKYAKLGWNEYWTNDEWWADAPKPTASL